MNEGVRVAVVKNQARGDHAYGGEINGKSKSRVPYCRHNTACEGVQAAVKIRSHHTAAAR
jgi:hypothetical protein